MINSKKCADSREIKLYCITIVVLFFLFTSYLLYRVINIPIEVDVMTKVNKDNDFELFFDKGDGFIEQNSVQAPVLTKDSYQIIKFKLPSNNVSRIRFDFGTSPGDIEIKEIVIKGLFNKHICNNNSIVEKFLNTNQLENLEIQDGLLRITSNKNDPYFYTNDITDIIRRVANYKILLSLLYVSLGILSILILKKIIPVVEKLQVKNISVRNSMVLCLFFVLLILPHIARGITGRTNNNSEKRKLAKMPTVEFNNIDNFVKSYDQYFNDNFGLRSELIKVNSYIHVNLLKTSPVDKVTIGKDGWFFYSNKGKENTIDLYRGFNLFTNTELEKIKENLVHQRDWLAKQNIPFILMIAPNKNSIYPEYLPQNVDKSINGTRLEQLIDYLNKNSDIKVVDLRENLINNKEIARLYYKTDTHWNSYGAFIGYETLMKEVIKYFPNIKVKKIEDYDIKTETINNGDLVNALALNRIIKEKGVLVQSKKLQAKDVESDLSLRGRIIKKTGDKDAPNLFMLRDSFTSALIPYLSEDFNTSIYNESHKFDKDLIKKAKPDIVIHEIVERQVHFLLEDN